jgi:endonuclease YncB( thermonuclease family)
MNCFTCNSIPDDAPMFNMFSERIIKAKVVDVYDGDTITCVTKYAHRGKFIKIKCRLIGVDTPEMRGGTDESKQDAIESRDFLSDLVFNKIVYLKCDINDKYGRVLVVVFTKNPIPFYRKNIYLDKHFAKSVNKVMLDKKLGVEYYGGKKYI